MCVGTCIEEMPRAVHHMQNWRHFSRFFFVLCIFWMWNWWGCDRDFDATRWWVDITTVSTNFLALKCTVLLICIFFLIFFLWTGWREGGGLIPSVNPPSGPWGIYRSPRWYTFATFTSIFFFDLKELRKKRKKSFLTVVFSFDFTRIFDCDRGHSTGGGTDRFPPKVLWNRRRYFFFNLILCDSFSDQMNCNDAFIVQ